MKEHPFSRSRNPQSRRPHRERSDRRSGALDKNIDQQILVIHQAIVEKLIAQPTLVESVKQQIEQKMASGHPKFKRLRSWWFILEGCHTAEQLREEILEDSAYKRQLRRVTPFTGILTEEERQTALAAAAIGHLDTILPDKL